MKLFSKIATAVALIAVGFASTALAEGNNYGDYGNYGPNLVAPSNGPVHNLGRDNSLGVWGQFTGANMGEGVSAADGIGDTSESEAFTIVDGFTRGEFQGTATNDLAEDCLGCGDNRFTVGVFGSQLSGAGARNTRTTDNGPAMSHSLGAAAGFGVGQAIMSWDVE